MYVNFLSFFLAQCQWLPSILWREIFSFENPLKIENLEQAPFGSKFACCRVRSYTN